MQGPLTSSLWRDGCECRGSAVGPTELLGLQSTVSPPLSAAKQRGRVTFHFFNALKILEIYIYIYLNGSGDFPSTRGDEAWPYAGLCQSDGAIMV